jgi:glycosyltransferase involved in cell wall biosynthesis
MDIGLLTGGSDKPYALGLASALSAQDLGVEFIGSNELDCPEVRGIAGLTFLNLRGDQREDVGVARKGVRILTYYARLMTYAALARPRVLHILWNNRFEVFDRTLLMLFYRLVGKRIVLTAHNVNAAKRDARDSWLNRASLRIQYRLCDHVFVHTEAMKTELIADFGVAAGAVSVIPFPINETIPTTSLTAPEAKQRLGLAPDEKTLLFFGQIAPYKGLEHLVDAMTVLATQRQDVRLIIAGKVKRGHAEYWSRIQRTIADEGIGHLVIQRIEFIPDNEVEPYFKAADGVVIPYVDIFQSGVPFLAFSFGVPVIASDVGSLRDDVTADTGLLSRPGDPADLARTIEHFFRSPLYLDLEARRERIRRFGRQHHSWTVVAEATKAVYSHVASGVQHGRDVIAPNVRRGSSNA